MNGDGPAVLTLLVAGLLIGGAPHAGAADRFGPWSVDPRHPAMADPATTGAPAQRSSGRSAGPGASPFSVAYLFWSELLTRIDGPRCAHRPTCSAYARQAVARHGLPLGLWMAFNRLMRGTRSSVLRSLPLAPGSHGQAFRDALEDNAFWLPGYAPWSGRKK